MLASLARYAFLVPPFDPLHAHVPLAHVGPDINGEPMWEIKNEVCARPGDNDPTKWGSGRFHMMVDPENHLHGHATQEELLVEQK